MDKIKLKVISLTLTGVTLFSLSSCSLKKNNPYDNTSVISKFDVDSFSNINDKCLRSTLEEFIDVLSNSDIDIDWDWDSFYDKLNNTIFEKMNDDGFILGYYDRDTNIFKYQENDKETINHELLHMLLPYFDNDCLNEGFVQLILNEAFGYEIDENEYDASICKILCRILEKDELKELLSGKYEVLPNKLSLIKPAYSDAEEFLGYLDDSNYYYRKLNESIFNDKLDEFKSTKDYTYLETLRRCIKGRIKIYLKNYYNPNSLVMEPNDALSEMFEVLNIITYYMHDSDLDGDTIDKDYFLEDNVNLFCQTYNIDDYTLNMIDTNVRNREQFTYLPKSDENIKINN